MKKTIILIFALFYVSMSFCQINSQPQVQAQTLTVDPIDPEDPIDPGVPGEVGKTNGQLAVSASGGAIYNVPFIIPQGINGVQPKIGLVYNSQGSIGHAGYGWNLSGLSAITRIAATKFHDGFNDPVDFDNNDRFALDGQRLILKEGAYYGAIGSTYITENFSNIIVTLSLAHSISYYEENGVSTTIVRRAVFKVQYPDGSVAFYGETDDSSTDTNAGICYWENPQGLRISYSYTKANNNSYINSVKYGGLGSAYKDEIKFNYITRARVEEYYIGSLKIVNDKILTSVNILSNNVGFRNYDFVYDNVIGYQRLKSITEKTGDGLKSLAPISFSYSANEAATKATYINTIGKTALYDPVTFVTQGNLRGSNVMDLIFKKESQTGTAEGLNLKKFNSLRMYNVQGSDHVDFDMEIESKYAYVFPGSPAYSIPLLSYNFPIQKILTANIVSGNQTDGFKTLKSDVLCVENKYNYNDGVNFNTQKFEINFYSKNSNNAIDKLEYTKNFTLPGHDGIITYETQGLSSQIIYKSLYGDFNGDGLSDVMMVQKKWSASDNEHKYARLYFIDLDKRAENDFVKDLGSFLNLRAYDSSTVVTVADVNGDGKSDIVVFDGNNNKIKAYTLGNNGTLQLIIDYTYDFVGDYAIILQKINRVGYQQNRSDNNFMIGDYNGDGKSDFIFPGEEKRVLFSTGSSFVEEVLPNSIDLSSQIDTGWLDLGGISFDTDNDGKSEVIIMKRGSNVPTEIILFRRSSAGNWTKFTQSITYVSGFGLIGVNPDTVLYDKNGIVFISQTPDNAVASNPWAISLVRFSDNMNSMKLIAEIGNNLTAERITYAPLKNNGYPYTAAPTFENYPNNDLINAPSFKVVSQIEKYNSASYKIQDYKYYGATSNLDGLGFLGFRSLLKTNWYSDPAEIISEITKFDLNKRGVPTDSFSVLGLANAYDTLSGGSSFITRTQTVYNNEDTVYENPLLSNKVFKLKKTSVKQTNGLEGTSKETLYDYNANNSPIQITSTYKKGATSEKTESTNLSYYPTITTPYMVDRLEKKTSSTTLNPSGDTTGAEENYVYNLNLLTQTKKKGNGTVYITEDNEYDSFGNITKNTVSAPDLDPRINKFEYDTSGRFLTKKTNIEGLISNYTYDSNNGLLLTESLPSTTTSALKKTYTYDSWGKLISLKDIYEKSVTYAYTNLSSGGIIKTITKEDGGVSKITTDASGREIKQEIKDINGSWSIVDTEYDNNDRVIRKSQPHNGTANVWNEMTYDVYGRLDQSIAMKSGSSSGKITTYTYSGTIATESDGIKSKETTKNSFGKSISVTETPGGTISYEYFANGNLKSTTCNGATILIFQDGWGNKIELQDPSAGNRKYEYNHFGELTKEEIVGKGEIKYDLNGAGRLLFKTKKNASGTATSKDTYTYTANNKLTESIRFDDYENATFTLNSFTYDTYGNTLTSTEELNGKAKFAKTITYDAFGRALTETYLAESKSDSKTLTRTITNVYKNGYKWKVTDNSAPTTPIWETKTINAKGQVLTAGLGNGVSVVNTYDIYGSPTQNKHDKSSTNIMTLTNTFDPVTGNLKTRSNNMFGAWSETLSYDTSDRLTTYKDVIGTQTQTYNDNGTIAKNNIGDYAYNVSGKPFQISSITPIDQSGASVILNYYIPKTQDIVYNIAKKPVSVKVATKENIDFEYNTYNGRSVMYYGSLDTDKTIRPYRKYYSADGTMEIKVKTTTPKSVEFTIFIEGDAYTAPAVLKSDGTTPKMHYLHRDYQGTIVGVTDASGVIAEKRMFDVWGEMIKYQKGAVTTVPTTTGTMLIDRGYTGHEHLLGVDLINMNGRTYDYKLHRFLQPDDNVQDPYNTQNYNRYAYVMNNPTKYTDPSGEFWAWAAGFLFSTYIHGAQATGNANPFGWTGAQWLNAGLSAGSSSLSYSITNYSNNFIDHYNDAPKINDFNIIQKDEAGYSNHIETPIGYKPFGFVAQEEPLPGEEYEILGSMNLPKTYQSDTSASVISSTCTYDCKRSIDQFFYGKERFKEADSAFLADAKNDGVPFPDARQHFINVGYQVSEIKRSLRLDVLLQNFKQNRVTMISWTPNELAGTQWGHASLIRSLERGMTTGTYRLGIMDPGGFQTYIYDFKTIQNHFVIWKD